MKKIPVIKQLTFVHDMNLPMSKLAGMPCGGRTLYYYVKNERHCVAIAFPPGESDNTGPDIYRHETEVAALKQFDGIVADWTAHNYHQFEEVK